MLPSLVFSNSGKVACLIITWQQHLCVFVYVCVCIYILRCLRAVLGMLDLNFQFWHLNIQERIKCCLMIQASSCSQGDISGTDRSITYSGHKETIQRINSDEKVLCSLRCYHRHILTLHQRVHVFSKLKCDSMHYFRLLETCF